MSTRPPRGRSAARELLHRTVRLHLGRSDAEAGRDPLALLGRPRDDDQAREPEAQQLPGGFEAAGDSRHDGHFPREVGVRGGGGGRALDGGAELRLEE